MSLKSSRSGRDRAAANGTRGFSTFELLVVCAISITIAAFAFPMFTNAYYDIRLKSACSDLSGLMQKARIQAARTNQTVTIGYRTATVQEAFIDLNNNGQWDSSVTVNGSQMPEPIIVFSHSIAMATGLPSGTGAPTQYVLVGDTAGTTYTNTTTLGYSSRGLPCAYAAGVCATPAAGYFVYYVIDQRPTGNAWGGVVVTRSGRTKTIIWNGTAWQ